jgi:DNA-binding XRE family transcriptional regulator
VNKPRIKFNISVDGNVSRDLLNKIAELVKTEYGKIEVTFDENEMMKNSFESDWYVQTKKTMKPGDYLRIYRENHDWTQEELGLKLEGLSRHYVSDMENGRRAISKETAKKLSSLFEVPIDRFI